MWFVSPITKIFLNILNIHNELPVKNCRPKAYFGKSMFMPLKKMLLCVQIKLLVVEVALGGISYNQSLEY